jgi:homeobox-leucine zipper protein
MGLNAASVVSCWFSQMFAEVQMLTPMVPTREFYFARYCKKLAAEKWAIVDVSFDKAEADVGASPLVRCWKNPFPSGCIIEEQANGHSRVRMQQERDING